MTIQEIISAVVRVYPQPTTPGWKGSRRHLASSRRVVVKLARVYLPHLGYADIKKGLGLHAHSSVIGAARKAPTLAEAQAFAAAEKLLVKKPQPIPPPASLPQMSEGARAIIGTLNADATARNEVLAYLRGVLTVAENIHRATAQQAADRQNQPGTVQGVRR